MKKTLIIFILSVTAVSNSCTPKQELADTSTPNEPTHEPTPVPDAPTTEATPKPTPINTSEATKIILERAPNDCVFLYRIYIKGYNWLFTTKYFASYKAASSYTTGGKNNLSLEIKKETLCHSNMPTVIYCGDVLCNM